MLSLLSIFCHHISAKFFGDDTNNDDDDNIARHQSQPSRHHRHRPANHQSLVEVSLTTGSKKVKYSLQGNADEEVNQLATDQTSENTWLSQEETAVTRLQPLRMVANEADSFFDFGLGEIESPGSPVDECEYTRLIETTSVTPAEAIAPESGYVCSSPCSTTPQVTSHENSPSSQASSDCQFYDPEVSDSELAKTSSGCDYYDCTISDPCTTTTVTSSSSPRIAASRQPHQSTSATDSATHIKSKPTSNGQLLIGCLAVTTDSDSCSESLPPSQSTTDTHDSTFTGLSSNNSNSTLQDVTMEGEDMVAPAYSKSLEVPNGDCCSSSSTCELSQPRDEPDDGKVLSNGHAIMPKQVETQIEHFDLNQTCHIDLMELINGDADDEPDEGESCLQVQLDEIEKKLQDCSVEKEEEEREEKQDLKKEGMSSGDEDEDFVRTPRVRRCSSLKTGKTPPGTPGRKKIVRFADVLGLDLADVKTFVDEVPKVPKSAYEDLEINLDPQPVQQISLGPSADRVLLPMFQQPGALPYFMDLVREKQVNLENAAVTDPITLTITGTVRVRNLDFHKSVYVRYSTDNWRSFSDLQASYVENSCDGFSDKFCFTIYGHSVQIGQRIEMAVRFHCRGQQFWDSNYGTNYVFHCLPVSQPNHIGNAAVKPANAESIISPDDAWCKSFY